MNNQHATTHPASSLIFALNLMRSGGHDVKACLAGTGLAANDLTQESRTVTLEQETVFYGNLLRITNDPCIGLQVGHSYLPQHYGLFGYALLSAGTGWQALSIATKYGHHLTYTWFQMSYAAAGDNVRFEFRDRVAIGGKVREMYFDRDCAAFYVALTEVLRRPVELARVWLPHDGHGQCHIYEAHFGCPVTFNHPVAAIEFPAIVLDSPLLFRDEDACQRLARQCHLMLFKGPRPDALADQVRGLLLERPGSFPDLDWVARRLGVSGRTLRRRLSEESTSYQAILCEVRGNLAREYLTETELPLQDIAALLGYSEPGNFTHAFKRWSGMTPNNYRKKKAI